MKTLSRPYLDRGLGLRDISGKSSTIDPDMGSAFSDISKTGSGRRRQITNPPLTHNVVMGSQVHLDMGGRKNQARAKS